MMKLLFARIAQQLSGLELELLGEDGLRYSDWTLRSTRRRRLHRAGRGLPLPARQGQFHRGRHLRDHAQHRRRARPRPPGGGPQ